MAVYLLGFNAITKSFEPSDLNTLVPLNEQERLRNNSKILLEPKNQLDKSEKTKVNPFLISVISHNIQTGKIGYRSISIRTIQN
jgi:hypothetical protein